MKSSPLITAIDFCPLIQQLSSRPIKRLAQSFLHCSINSAKIGLPSHISCPQSDGALVCDGEQFFSLLCHYMSCAEWNCVPLSFYRLIPKGSAINIAYCLTFFPHPITDTHLRCLITVGSVHMRSNGSHSLHYHLFRYPLLGHLHLYFPDPTADLSPSSIRHGVHIH